MEQKKIYYFKRDNTIGFDKITIIAYTLNQANTVLDELVKNPGDWYNDDVRFLVPFDDDYDDENY